MAKVNGPLHSDSASGKIANALVFFAVRGINVVRQYVIPKNIQSEDQGDQRLVLGGAGRACSVVKANSLCANAMNVLGLVKGKDTKQSYLVRKMIALYMNDATAFEAMVTEFAAHTAKTDFTAQAELIGLSDFDIEYKGTTSPFSKGLMLYALAKTLIAVGLTGAPYSVKLADWVDAQILLLVADFEVIV